MKTIPRYEFPLGTEVEFFSTRMALTGQTEDGYELAVLATNTTRVISFQHFVDYLKLPGTKIDRLLPETGNRLQQRMGGYASALNLPTQQQEYAQFHLSLCKGMQLLRDKIRSETNNPIFELSNNKMNERHNRLFVKKIAEQLFDKTIYIDPGTGDRRTSWGMYKGRTLMTYFREFENLHPGESPLDALVTLDHLKGNRVARIVWRVKDLMTKAWEEIGLDTKIPSVANVMKHLELLIHEENGIRKRNDLPRLMTPSASTLAAHREYLFTPLEYAVATKGERHTRNTRGRGSTDIRALMVGEYVEIDECKGSLIVSAKERGLWERLSEGDKKALESMDEWIRERLIILVMIDVATRMPLAWVISDQPKAVATLALFRMATRDKTREKIRYGCDGNPVHAVGIGHVKNDNGPGLRNAETIGAALGIGAINTVTRAYAATDKPYIERMFGTTESVLLKLIHGYTGRRSGELPGYDATENGVLVIDEIYGILTRFMIDEYPSMRHAGVGMGRRRPYEVYRQINDTRGHFLPPDPNQRRINLGWDERVTPSDEGVKVSGLIWYNSNLLQLEIERNRKWRKGQPRGKVSVFVDPDDMNRATVLVPGVKDAIEVAIQITAFADMTLPEILNLMAAYRKENPKVTEIHEDRLMRARRDRYDQLKAIGVERGLPRSYSTVEECRMKASSLLQGARIIKTEPLPATLAAGSVTRLDAPGAVFQLGTGNGVIDGNATEAAREEVSADPAEPLPTQEALPQKPGARSIPPKPVRGKQRRSDAGPTGGTVLGPPKNPKELE